MKKRNPIERSKYIESRYKEYLRSSFEFGSARLQRLFDKQLDGETLFKGPYVDLNLPFRRGENLDSLINEGVLCKSFRTLGDTNFERPLYSHQEEAIRRIGAGRSAIVTTGTGSGKTECFLYPIFNEILQDLEKGNSEAGIRAIFLYPMNALVNDQIDRLRKILSTCPDITFGFFTGDTKETVARNYREKYFEEYEIHIPKNELVSREEIRKNPPHLLFTNYSMLEYLLIRPNDYAIFEPSRLQNWKFVVLDEAHSYSGSLGIELSLLIRRLTGLAPKKPRFILTSATLGEQGKSESKIVEFARNLTSANFEIEDIIFSKRIPLNPVKLMYSVAGPDYTALKAAIKDIEQIKKIASKYKKVTGSDASQCLYELLESDYNVYEIYKFLKGGCKSFAKLYDNIAANIAQNELIYLIDLINQAEKDGIGLFDLKYHSFVRPLSGAYITLGKDQKLSLTKTNHIEGQKAFEIGNCRFCGSSYIIGKIQHNNIDNLDYLLQNNEVDIYENYGDNKYVSLDYFLLENTVNEDEIDLAVLEEHKVCSKCGSIYPAANLNAVKCKCDDSYLCSVYRVCLTIESGDEVAFNNINQCPCCAHRSRSGVVKSLNLGKDEGTALIAQILYEVIDEGKVAKKKTEKLSLTRKGNNSSTEETAKVKQFLAFSDSRQQASFAAVFLDANYVRMMQKRLIWKVVEDSGYREIPVDEMVSRLTSIIKEESLFSSDLSAHKKAWITVLYDLLKVDGAYDGEGLGLYYFDLDIKDIMSQIDEIEVKEAFGQYGITKADLETIMQVVFGVFKVTPAISYVKSTLTPEEKLQALEYRRFDNYVMFHSPKSTQGIRSFLPVRNGSNIVVRYIQKVFGCSNEMAKTVLNVLFNNLAVEGGLLKKHASKEAYQIDASKYIIKNYMNTEYYRCTKCGRLTPYNVHNICVQDKCDGTLVAVDPDEVLSTNYYRNQYKSMKIESVVIKEHTAQLDRKKAKQYQKDFKNKKINILSCSTTFEMGIDIGGLETVFMRNVPPSPANYVQRAGRAGRRKESSAYILTYCGTGSHDYTYFCEPEKMISGIINPPYFNVINKKIIIRHLMAACLGFFFRENPGYFENISSLVFNNGINAFKKYIESHPTKLNEYINNKVLPENTYREYHNFKWFDDMKGKDEKLEYFEETIRTIYNELQMAKQVAVAEEKYSDADYYTRQIDKLQKTGVVESLSKYCVIPKYGFPVDVVELRVYNDGVPDNNIGLNRDLRIAISEYAPDSEVVADGKKYTSKYITLPKTSQFQKYYFSTCASCRKVNVFLSTLTKNKCKYCGRDISTNSTEYYIEPIYGFKTGITKESTRMKPKRSYSGEVSYLGGGTSDDNLLNIGGTVYIETSTNDELLVMNRATFYFCPVCGYSEIANDGVKTPSKTIKHKNFRQFECNCTELDKIRLGHSFQTDVAKFSIPSLVRHNSEDLARALSFMYAFLEGISNAIGIERNDIDGILEVNLEHSSYDILIYDNVPGGAGHVKRLVSRNAVVNSLQAAHRKVSQQCCDEYTSCYNCLRNYYNQTYHSKLQRKYAKDFIECVCQLETEPGARSKVSH